MKIQRGLDNHEKHEIHEPKNNKEGKIPNRRIFFSPDFRVFRVVRGSLSFFPLNLHSSYSFIRLIRDPLPNVG